MNYILDILNQQVANLKTTKQNDRSFVWCIDVLMWRPDNLTAYQKYANEIKMLRGWKENPTKLFLLPAYWGTMLELFLYEGESTCYIPDEVDWQQLHVV